MSKIEEIAGAHLGKTSDGKTMMRYETPTEVDPSLLVGVPRELNRVDYGITDDSFVGFDVWNAYEFSYLKPNGLPVSGVLHISYTSNSKCIVESKSLKLYLNSYNLCKLIVDPVLLIKQDLMPVLGVDDPIQLNVVFVKGELNNSLSHGSLILPELAHLEAVVNTDNVQFTATKEDPSLLEAIEDGRMIRESFSSSLLRSNCRVTNQPDWGDVIVTYRGKKRLAPLSLLKYIVSMRNENHFHEEICECIYKRLYDLLQPEDLVVICLYTRRGGIDINPVRASSSDAVRRVFTADPFATNEQLYFYPLPRTIRQ